MNKANLQPLKGFRDFYPEQMRFRNFLFGKMREISKLFGYEEYEGPTLEPLELYAAKSGEELVKNQTFVLKDKNNNNLAMRPELTPTLARMVAGKQNELVFPLRWFSIGPRWRYEQPQKGRFREFWQWDLDIIGLEKETADAEVITVACEFLKSLGLSPKEVRMKINNRQFLQRELEKVKINADKIPLIYKAIDKKDKMKGKDWEKYIKDVVNNQEQEKKIRYILENKNIPQELENLFYLLEKFGVGRYIEFDPTIVRGLDYYTGTVFEARDADGKFRTIIGGGRYDNLVGLFGDKKIPGVGFATGDAVLYEVLKKFNKIKEVKDKATVMVAALSPNLFDIAYQIAALLRKDKFNAEVYFEENKLEKQLKYADRKKIPFVIIVGPDEAKKNQFLVKNLLSGEQKAFYMEEFGSFEKLLEQFQYNNKVV